ncbi:tumor necrosis factor ligand superfamily member 6 [Biomphalaria pfeifferi]|uniref:Tumor necrosis factor ligand superfamily member 6 n=1 Tax=Biomphalaria pfeifferi TaxID=112525 RepID=A0AAD8FEM7_BIOPF|nr:tumor necrosis factor ligand superfamily member 6 [Biomphalaria pfeifferi]
MASDYENKIPLKLQCEDEDLLGKKDENDHRCKNNKRQYISVIISIFAIIFSITSIVLASVNNSRTAALEDSTRIEVIHNFSCTECHLFPKPEHQYLLNHLTRYRNETTEQCCAQNFSQLSALLTLEILSFEDEELPPVINPDSFSMGDVSMHKKLIASTIVDDNAEYPIFDPLQSYNLKFATDEDNPLLEHNRNVELLASGTKIKQSGLYFVYVSVHFKPDSPEPCKTFDQKTFSVNITKHQDGAIILSAIHTCCDDCIRNQETGFTAGVFQLKENDFLTVDVSGEGLVSYRPQSTFFGLTMLSKTQQPT